MTTIKRQRLSLKSVERCAIVTHLPTEFRWRVDYYNRQTELFKTSYMNFEYFYTETRARQSAALWERKGRSLPTDKWKGETKKRR